MHAALPAALKIFGAIMPHGVSSGKANSNVDAAVFSAKRNDPQDEVERSETRSIIVREQDGSAIGFDYFPSCATTLNQRARVSA